MIACVSAAEPDLITGVRFDERKPRRQESEMSNLLIHSYLQQKMLSVTGVSLSVTLLATQVPCKDVV